MTSDHAHQRNFGTRFLPRPSFLEVKVHCPANISSSTIDSKCSTHKSLRALKTCADAQTIISDYSNLQMHRNQFKPYLQQIHTMKGKQCHIFAKYEAAVVDFGPFHTLHASLLGTNHPANWSVRLQAAHLVGVRASNARRNTPLEPVDALLS